MARRDNGQATQATERGSRPPGLLINFAAGMAACLSLLGLLSAGGAWSESLDLLNHATPLFVAGGVLGMAIAWLRPNLRRAPLLLVVGAAGVLAAGARVIPEWLSRPAQASLGAATVTVLTQNVWDANPDPHATARALASTGADIILLQELDNPQARIVARDLERLYPFAADCTLVNKWCSLAIISRLPINAWSYHQGNWKPPRFDRLVLVRATIDSHTLGRFDVIDTKLAHPYTRDLQRTQIARLVDQVRGVEPAHTILAGDFNLTPWSYALRRIDRAIELVRRTRGLATWPNRLPLRHRVVIAPFPVLPIDQVFAGSAWRTVAVRRGPRTASDHYGVLVTLAPADPPATR